MCVLSVRSTYYSVKTNIDIDRILFLDGGRHGQTRQRLVERVGGGLQDAKRLARPRAAVDGAGQCEGGAQQAANTLRRPPLRENIAWHGTHALRAADLSR